jgi:ferritin-like metal-binding protein YciE
MKRGWHGLHHKLLVPLPLRKGSSMKSNRTAIQPLNREKFMAETVHDRINRYLEDTIAAERNFEHALSTFGDAGDQEPVQRMLSSFSDKARTQHQRLTALLESRGGSPSEAKTLLAQLLAFTPLTAQIGQGAAEKNTQHLMVTFAAAAAEMAMYESLANAAEAAGETEVVELARTLQKEEREDYDQVWEMLSGSAAAALGEEIAKGKDARDRINTYLTDAIAAEKSFETQLNGFAKETEGSPAASLFAQHARETRTQYEELTSRLEGLGASPSSGKTLLAHIFNAAPKVAQIGHDDSERLTQDLMMAFAVENAEVAMYESLAVAARSIGDSTTEELAKTIQQQEKRTAEKVWAEIAPAARQAIEAVRFAKAS